MFRWSAVLLFVIGLHSCLCRHFFAVAQGANVSSSSISDTDTSANNTTTDIPYTLSTAGTSASVLTNFQTTSAFQSPPTQEANGTSGTPSDQDEGGLTGTNLILAIAIPVAVAVLGGLAALSYYCIIVRPNKKFKEEYAHKVFQNESALDPLEATINKKPFIGDYKGLEEIFPTSRPLTEKQRNTAMTEFQFQLALEEDPTLLQEMNMCSSPLLLKDSPRHFASEVVDRRQSQMAATRSALSHSPAVQNDLAAQLLHTHMATDNKKLNQKKRSQSVAKERQLRAHLLDVTLNSKKRSRSTVRVDDDGIVRGGEGQRDNRTRSDSVAQAAGVLLQRGDGRFEDAEVEAAYFKARFVHKTSKEAALRSGVDVFERSRGASLGQQSNSYAAEGEEENEQSAEEDEDEEEY